MGFKKPFRAVPIKPSERYMAQRKADAGQPSADSRRVVPFHAPKQAPAPKKSRRLKRSASHIIIILAGAVSIGATAGIGSVVLQDVNWSAVRALAVDAGLVRAREPRAGDVWSNCTAARAAGTAPIYAREPGYRPELDRDGDGIACEPYRGT